MTICEQCGLQVVTPHRKLQDCVDTLRRRYGAAQDKLTAQAGEQTTLEARLAEMKAEKKALAEQIKKLADKLRYQCNERAAAETLAEHAREQLGETTERMIAAEAKLKEMYGKSDEQRG